MKTLNKELKIVMKIVRLTEKMENKVEKEMDKEVKVEVEVNMIMKKKRKEVKVGEMMKKVKVKMEKNLEKKWDVKVEQGLNAEHVQRIRRALDKSRLNMRVRQAVDIIKAWKALPPREFDKASAVKMTDDAIKPLDMFGSPTPPNLRANQ
ncbi:hypothetical protein Scep_010426 [Stephania cephalantha]|uniref:Uncharacterized protein n=1 Tax=Stephania cephalantha TaxID=152367 RepID=A0AAP0JX91_9MAGN